MKNLIETSDGYFVGTPAYIPPETLKSVGMTPELCRKMSEQMDLMDCEDCGEVNYLHTVDGELNIHCPRSSTVER